MAVIERLLTMGLAHGADPARHLLGALGVTGPAADNLTWPDLRACIGCLDYKHRAILLIKATPEMVEGKELAALTDHLYRDLIRYEARPKANWSQIHHAAARAVHRATRARQAAIVRTALQEYADPRVCRSCKGKQQVGLHTPGKGVEWVSCELCQGRGWLSWSDNRRAAAVGVKRGDWVHRHSPSYEHVLQSCTALYRESVTLFKAQLLGR